MEVSPNNKSITERKQSGMFLPAIDSRLARNAIPAT